MNTTGLAKHYDTLTPRERLPLIISAVARGDEIERQRLMDSAPMERWRISDYFGLSLAIQHLTFLHGLTLLDLAGSYWIGAGALEQLDWLFEGEKDLEEREDRFWNSLRMIAFRFLVNADAWKSFCAEQGLPADTLLSPLPGANVLTHTDSTARLVAFSHEEATEFLRQAGKTCAAETVEEVVADMREFLEQQAAKWE